MFAPYRALFRVPGGAAFSAAGLVGRLPISMMALGFVLLVAERTGSYSLAGSVAAAYVVAEAVCSIPQGRLIDRFGQARFLSISIIGFAVLLALTLVAVERSWALPLPHLLAFATRLFLPPIGSCVRVRWSHQLTEQPRQLQTAFSFEAVVDETVFVTGPILVTVLATAWDPIGGLVVAGVAGVVGTLALAVQRGTEPPLGASRGADAHGRGRVPWRTMAVLGAVCLALGTFFGSAEVSTVGAAESLGNRAAAGPLLALWAFGSLLAGAISGAMTWRVNEVVRIRVGLAALAVLMAPLLVVDNLYLMALVLFLAGFAISPTLIGSMSRAEQVLPRGRLTEGMAILQSGLAAGVALGAPAAGLVIDHVDASASYGVTVVAAVLGAAIACTLRQPAATSAEKVSPVGPVSPTRPVDGAAP